MIESSLTYNLAPGVDEEIYWSLIKRIVTALIKDKKIIEFRASRNMLGEPAHKIAISWDLMTHWAAFTQSEEWQLLEKQLRSLTTGLKVEVWTGSDYMPEPVHP